MADPCLHGPGGARLMHGTGLLGQCGDTSTLPECPFCASRRQARGPRPPRLTACLSHLSWYTTPFDTLGFAPIRSRCRAARSGFVAPWCSGLTCHPVTVEIVGSNPI